MFGPEPWSDVAGRPWSHWDLWFAAVAVSDHEGSFDDLEARFVAQRRSHVGRQGAESKLSHLADLRSRLEAAGFSAADLATPEVLADRADDSHGNVGQLRRDAWHTYLGIDWQATGLAAEDYWADVCDLAVFEDCALDYQAETLPWRGVPAGHAELIEGLLQQLAWLAVGGRRFSRYVEAAARLGSDHWMPIEAMAESALRSGRRELAVEVFRAADRPGFHQRHLRQRCLALTGADIDDEGHDPRPTLRVVESPGGHP